jgi:glycosyltransferase involved in cell wall biosynthesis
VEETNMKICMLVPFPLKNQIEQHRLGNSYSVGLIDALSEECYNLDMTILANKYEETEKQEYKNFKIKRLWYRGKLNPFTMFKEIILLKPDIIHIQYVLGAKFGKYLHLLNPFLFMLFLRIARYPLIISIHDMIPSDQLSSTFKILFRNHPLVSFINRIGYRLATMFMGKVGSKIIVLDHGTEKWAKEQYGFSKKKITLIPHGMLKDGGDITHQHGKKSLGINENWNLLLFFGNIHPRKGIEFAIKALPYVLKEHPNTKLLIAGSDSGTWKDESKSYSIFLKKLVTSLGLEKSIIFEIKYLGEEIPLIFGAADIILLPYILPFGASGVVKLAATYKKPVITPFTISREGEIVDGKSGVLLQFLNEKILANKINQLLEDKSSLHGMGERFYEENLKSSDWKKVAKQTLEFYRSM